MHRISALRALLLTATLAAGATSARAQQPPQTEKGSRIAVILLPGASLKLPTARHYRFWGPSLGVQLDVVAESQPWAFGVRAALHIGGRGYPDGVSMNFSTLQLGPELGYQLGSGPWAVRPSVGVGYMAQLGADEYGETLDTAYVSPSIAGLWSPGVLLGLELRPIFGLSDRAQHGLALSALVGLPL